jgi:hypothetical protein
MALCYTYAHDLQRAMQACKNALTHIRTFTYTHTQIHSCTHTHTHTLTSVPWTTPVCRFLIDRRAFWARQTEQMCMPTCVCHPGAREVGIMCVCVNVSMCEWKCEWWEVYEQKHPHSLTHMHTHPRTMRCLLVNPLLEASAVWVQSESTFVSMLARESVSMWVASVRESD